MNLNDIDFAFQKYYRKDYYGNHLHSGDIVISYNNLNNASKLCYSGLTSYDIAVVEYFKTIDGSVIPFLHSYSDISYKICPITDTSNKVKLSLDDLEKFSIYDGDDIVNFKNSVYYKFIKKIKRGIFFRNKWVEKSKAFSIIKMKINGIVNDKFCIENEGYNYVLDDFYKREVLNDANRNLEIFCENPYDEKHIEYFFKFKKGE